MFMKRDVKALLLGLGLWVLGSIAIPLAIQHHANLDLPPTTADVIYHWAGVFGLIFLVAGCVAVFGASVAFAGRFAPANALIAGLAFLVPAALYWAVTRAVVIRTYDWVFLLIPWFVAILSGALLLFVGASRFIVSKLRQ
jgi:hypothetical protein